MTFQAGLPTPPMETSDEPLKTTSPPPDLIRCQLNAMGEAGLDQPRFEAFLSDHEYLDWPHGALAVYFDGLAETAAPVTEGDAAHFEQLGIKPDKAAELALEYPECEELGWMPTDLLVMHFGFIAQTEETRILRQSKFIDETNPENQYILIKDLNLQRLLKTPVGSKATIQIPGQRLSLTDEPLYVPKVLQRFEELPAGPEFFYHSTTIANGMSIMISGPLVGSPSNRPNDFDGAFYCNDDPGAAHRSAHRLAKANKTETIVLVFKVPKADRDGWAELKLKDDALWHRIVTSFRRQLYGLVDLQLLMQNYDVITGPILANPTQTLSRAEAPRALGTDQVTFLSHRLGASLRQYIVGYKIVGPGRQ